MVDNEYTQYLNEIVSIIKKYGVPEYIKKFNKANIDIPDTINSENEFLKEGNTILSKYHPHSGVYKNDSKSSKHIKKNKDTEFTFGKDKIAKIKLFSFTSYNGPKQYDIEKKKYVKEINDFLDTCTENGMKGLIVDFTKNGGGGVWQMVDAFMRYLNNTSLFAWYPTKVKPNEKHWTNVENNKVVWNKGLLKSTGEHIPIAVLISSDTGSAGEIGASMFKSHPNVKLFGEKTKGMLSVNMSMPIDKKYEVVITTTLQTSNDGTFKEYLEPDVYTKTPSTAAKEWIHSLKN